MYRKGIVVGKGNHEIESDVEDINCFEKEIKICHFKWTDGIVDKLKYRVDNWTPCDNDSRKYINECKKAIDIYQLDAFII